MNDLDESAEMHIRELIIQYQRPSVVWEIDCLRKGCQRVNRAAFTGGIRADENCNRLDRELLGS